MNEPSEFATTPLLFNSPSAPHSWMKFIGQSINGLFSNAAQVNVVLCKLACIGVLLKFFLFNYL